MSHPITCPCFASQPRGSLLLYSLDKLLATIQTILVSFKSTFCVFFFRTLFHGNVFIYQLAAHWAKSHWSVSTSMIKVSAIVSPRYHLFLLPIHISMVFSRWVLRSYLSSSGTGRRFLQAIAVAPALGSPQTSMGRYPGRVAQS